MATKQQIKTAAVFSLALRVNCNATVLDHASTDLMRVRPSSSSPFSGSLQ